MSGEEVLIVFSLMLALHFINGWRCKRLQDRIEKLERER